MTRFPVHLADGDIVRNRREAELAIHALETQKLVTSDSIRRRLLDHQIAEIRQALDAEVRRN